MKSVFVIVRENKYLIEDTSRPNDIPHYFWSEHPSVMMGKFIACETVEHAAAIFSVACHTGLPEKDEVRIIELMTKKETRADFVVENIYKGREIGSVYTTDDLSKGPPTQKEIEEEMRIWAEAEGTV